MASGGNKFNDFAENQLIKDVQFKECEKQKLFTPRAPNFIPIFREKMHDFHFPLFLSRMQSASCLLPYGVNAPANLLILTFYLSSLGAKKTSDIGINYK